MNLLPIQQSLADNSVFAGNPLCDDTLGVTIGYYQKVGFVPPWISYYAEQDGTLMGVCAFKGRPIDGSVEIAYGTFEPYQQRGVATQMCAALVDLARQTDPSVRVTARTLPENNFSTRVLKKNGFVFMGTVTDPEDGEVWEWVYVPTEPAA